MPPTMPVLAHLHAPMNRTAPFTKSTAEASGTDRALAIAKRVDALLAPLAGKIREELLARIKEIEGEIPTDDQLMEFGESAYPQGVGQTLKIFGWKGNPVLSVDAMRNAKGKFSFQITKFYPELKMPLRHEPRAIDDLPPAFDWDSL